MAKQESEDKITTSLNTIMAAVLSVVLICSFAIPVIMGSAGVGGLTEAWNSKFGGLIEVVVIVLIIGLIIPIVRGYNSNKR